MNLILFLFITITLSSYSCMGTSEKSYPACYGVEFNPTRAALGISLLKEDWVSKDSTENSTVWRSSIKKARPYHVSKHIRYFNGTLAWEADTYYSNVKYTTEDGTGFDALCIIYYYISSDYESSLPPNHPEIGKVGFVYEYIHCHKSGFTTTRDLVTKSQADSLLISWGLGDEIVPLSTNKQE